MTTFAVTNSDQLLPAVNYLLSNLDTTGSGNVVLPGNVLVANTQTGVISQEGNATPFGYLYQYVNLRYSNNATGTAGFDTNSNNYSYFGVYNSATSAASANPSAYQWYQVSPPFDTATSRILYYSAIGGRQVQWQAASSPPSTSFQVTVANVAIDLDVVTTAAGTPGDRGPIAVAFVITTADPNGASDIQLTGWFSASRENTTPPIGTGLTPVVGDTATFTYTAGAGQPSATLTYNGSAWIPVDGQVVNGNVIIANSVPGSSIVLNSITGNRITANTITGNLITSQTITANNIASNTITAGQIAATTITADKIATGTITANQIAGNTIVANNIQTGTLTTNLFTANTINGNIITAGTLNANKITANSITASQISTAYLYTGNIVSQTAQIGNVNSTGYWLNYVNGDARFGGNVNIGANLSVTGLITAGNLNSNTVQTTTIIPNGVTNTARGQVGVVTLAGNAIPGTVYTTPGATFTTTQPNEQVLIYMTMGAELFFTAIGGAATQFGQLVTSLQRYQGSGPGLTLQSASKFFTVSQPGAGQTDTVISVSQEYPTVIDVVASPGTYVYAFGASIQLTTSIGNYTSRLRTWQESGDNTVFLNTISVVGLKR